MEELANTVGKERVRGIKIAKGEKLSLFGDITISITSLAGEKKRPWGSVVKTNSNKRTKNSARYLHVKINCHLGNVMEEKNLFTILTTTKSENA